VEEGRKQPSDFLIRDVIRPTISDLLLDLTTGADDESRRLLVGPALGDTTFGADD
jgi:hypothetical protein